MNVHRRIKDFRLARNMTHQQFADAVGVTRGAVQQWEKENGTAPNRARQPAVAKYMGITVDELMVDSGVALGGSIYAKQNMPVAHVQQAQAAINNVAIPAEFMQLCQMFASLPNDPFIRADVMGKISAMIQQARASPAHQDRPETGAKQRAA